MASAPATPPTAPKPTPGFQPTLHRENLDRSTMIVHTLKFAELRLNNAIAHVQAAHAKNPKALISAALMFQYNQAHDAFRNATYTWIDAYQKTPPDQLPTGEANKPAVFPLRFALNGALTAGLGAGGPSPMIPLSQVMVQLQTGNQLQTLPLGAAELPRQYPQSQNGLEGVGLIAILVTLTIMAICATIWAYHRDTAEIETQHWEAEQTKSLSEAAEAKLAAYSKTVVACGPNNPDCVASVSEQLPGAGKIDWKPEGKGGFSFFQIIGVIAVVAAVGAGGYALWRWRKNRNAIPEARVIEGARKARRAKLRRQIAGA